MDAGWIELVIMVAFFVGVYFIPRVTCGVLFATVAQKMGWIHFLDGTRGDLTIIWVLATFPILSLFLLDLATWISFKAGMEHLFGNSKLGIPSCSDRIFDAAESDP